MKRFLLICLCLCMVLCLCVGLASCKDDPVPTPPPADDGGDTPPAGDPPPAPPTEYTVTLVYGNGAADTVYTVPVGGYAVEPEDPVRDGYQFDGWYAEGKEEVFNFAEKLTGNVKLTAHWVVPEPETVILRWVANESTDYLYDAGVPRSAKVGDTVRFRLRLSPYYEGTPTVTAGEQTLTPGGDGYYSFKVTAETTVRVTGREEIVSPIQGLGTERNPYLITNATQLRDFATSVNSTTEDKYNGAYIRLDADIDLAGEVLTPIGQTLNYAHFEGVFDGNGHTVSNFQMAVAESMCGFFGYVVAGEVTGLTLSDVTVDIEATDAASNYITGGVVAYNMGSTIVDCHFNGEFSVYSTLSPDTNAVYVGGIVGFMQGYSTDYTAEVNFCTVNADVHSTGTHAIMTVGGVAAATFGSADSATAMVFNCTYNGDIDGKIMYAGGIVGYLRNLSGVANCYSAGSVYAEYMTGTAAAGAIVGFALNETAVSYCYSTAEVDYRSKEDPDVTRSALVGAAFGDGADGVDDRKALVFNCFDGSSGSVTVSGHTYQMNNSADVLAMTGWRAGEWSFDANGKPTPDTEGYAVEKTTVTFHFKGETVTQEGLDGQPLSQGTYVPELYGYTSVYFLCGGAGQNTFTADSGKISYGFFLDESCTRRVPAAMMMTEDITVYVGFADYSEVAGDYYLDIIDTDGVMWEVHLVFDDNGKMTMYYEGRISHCMYVYDGERIKIDNAYFAFIKYPVLRDYDYEFDFYAEIENNTLNIYDNTLFMVEDNENMIAHPGNAIMGTWHNKDGGTFVFYANGTGLDSSLTPFTYTVTAGGVTVNQGTVIINLNLSVDGLTLSDTAATLSLSKYDAFRGTWEGAYNLGVEITFDGSGNVSFGDINTSYTVADGVLSFVGYTATFNEDGLLVLTETATGKTTVMGKGGSYIGTWYDSVYKYTMVLEGIGKDGYGFGYDSNGADFTYIRTSSGTYFMYYRLETYGYFDFAEFDPAAVVPDRGDFYGTGSETRMLTLAVFTPASGYIVDDYSMCYIDAFAGTWYGSDDLTLAFNGFGAYDFLINLSTGPWTAFGILTVTENGESTDIDYRVDLATGNATFTYKDKSYVVSLTETGLSAVIDGNDTAIYALPDAFDGFVFTDNEITVSFNGKSDVGLGEAVVTTAAGEVTYTYTMSGNVATLYTSGAPVGTATVNGTTGWLELVLNSEPKKDLGLSHAVYGKEYLGSDGTVFRLTGLFNINGEATGKFGETDVQVIYVDHTTVALYIDSTFLYYVVVQDEKNVGFFDEMQQLLAIFTVSDGLEGTYTNAAGDTLELDGCSNASKFIYASAIYKVTEGNEEVTYYYVYEIVDGVITVYELDRSGSDPVKNPVFSISLTEVPGSVAFTDGEGDTIYLVEISDS